MEVTATPIAKRMVADWFESMAARSITETIVEIPRWFIEAFDRIFGDRHLTLRCFLRSCVASIMAVFVMTIMWAVFDPTSWQEYLSAENGKSGIYVIFFLALTLNLVPDYISLLETRFILRRVAHAGIERLIVLLILDIIITGAIFGCGVAITILITEVVTGESFYLVSLSLVPILFWIICNPFQTYGPPLPLCIYFYSTYFTSVWLYLFMASSITAKLAYSLGRIGNWVMSLLDIERKPFQSMGIITMGVVTLALAIYAIMGAIS